MSNLKTIVFGAHGAVGQHVIRKLGAASLVTAVVRNDEQAEAMKKIGGAKLSTVNLSIEDASVEEIESACKGHDVVVYTAGSKGKSLLRVDLDGTVKTFEGAAAAGSLRYILVSALLAENRAKFSKTGLRDYMIAKHYAERILIDEFSDKLKYTILRPTSLTNDKGTGKIAIFKSEDEPAETVTREDVADVIILVMDMPSTIGKAISFRNGDQPIEVESTYD